MLGPSELQPQQHLQHFPWPRRPRLAPAGLARQRRLEGLGPPRRPALWKAEDFNERASALELELGPNWGGWFVRDSALRKWQAKFIRSSPGTFPLKMSNSCAIINE